MKLMVRGATDLGLKRSQNEDSHGSWLPDSAEERERRGALLVVADGMGGSRGGEVASRLTVETVLRAYREAGGADLLQDLRGAVETANQVVHAESVAHAELGGMGTTCTAVVVRDAEAYVAHVGDSRAYLLRDGRIEQLTSDHSLVAQLVRDRHLTPDQARTDPRRNVVTRSVGIGSEVQVDVERVGRPLEPGDTLLLCTDGLHGLVRDEELSGIASGPSLEQACQRLIELARERGGPDNITVMLGRLAADGGGALAVDAGVERARAGARTFALVVLALLGLLVALAAFAWLALRSGGGPARAGGRAGSPRASATG